MTDNVVPIKPPTAETEGLRACMRCKHEWIGVAPVGTVWLDCPACGANCGRSKGTVSRGGMHWQCNCGCDVFYIDTISAYCLQCGERNYPS